MTLCKIKETHSKYKQIIPLHFSFISLLHVSSQLSLLLGYFQCLVGPKYLLSARLVSYEDHGNRQQAVRAGVSKALESKTGQMSYMVVCCFMQYFILNNLTRILCVHF